MKEFVILMVLILCVFWTAAGLTILDHYFDQQNQYTYYPVSVNGSRYYIRYDKKEIKGDKKNYGAF